MNGEAEVQFVVVCVFLKDFTHLFLERGEERERERERNTDVREKYQPVASRMHPS